MGKQKLEELAEELTRFRPFSDVEEIKHPEFTEMTIVGRSYLREHMSRSLSFFDPDEFRNNRFCYKDWIRYMMVSKPEYPGDAELVIKYIPLLANEYSWAKDFVDTFEDSWYFEFLETEKVDTEHRGVVKLEMPPFVKDLVYELFADRL